MKGNKIFKYRSKPQHPIDVFIADFYCHKLKLVIEIDGGIHKEKHQKKHQAEYDIGRTVELEKFGIKVLRFENEKMSSVIVYVISRIEKVCMKRKDEIVHIHNLIHY